MDAAGRVIRYIESLRDFWPTSFPEPNDHIDATLTDAVLQAGIDFERVVRPRIDAVRQHSEARTTSDFLALPRSQGAARVLKWKGGRKSGTVLALTELLAAEGLETEIDPREWFERPDNAAKLLKVNGVDPETIHYLQILVGTPTVAVDRHAIDFLGRAGVTVEGYEHAREVLLEVARRMDVNPAHLDYSVWKYGSSTRTRLTGRCKRRPKLRPD